ncbi:cell wall-active antibiotics response protein LiaF [Bacillus xiapuensis]|uniref:Cell wall-active antibiotics response protein LiaF n=1 Tax=Bacillus xiapuensis TaxID=2014075 RepID=A0ABU6N9H8_9BACI|nr:cell wall-active antibiotics response protein LiaF [Bacillus xiapuensis]
MLKNTKNDYIGWLVMIGALVLGLEILFFNRGLIFSLIFSCGLIYLGRKKAGKKRGRVLFIAGIFFFIISIINMMTFKFLLLAILLHFFIQFITSKKNPKKIQVEVAEPKQVPQEETMYKSKPLFENNFFGQQKTPQGVYEWEDINIQTGIGDTVIDLSYTMLPKGETVVFIRNIIGNIQILVPYEIEVSIHHSCMAGSTTIFGHHEPKVINQVIHLKTPGYEHAEQKVKIFTSLVVGNLEVSRI